MNELVSIIMPTYNASKYITESVDSVLAQTYQNWELIIIDDGSKDNTAEIIGKYTDKRIKLIRHKENMGVAVAQNTGLANANGRWIAFLDSDDEWLPNKLEEQLKFMTENNYSFSYTDYIEVDEDGKELGNLVTGPNHITKCGMYLYNWIGNLTVIYDASITGKLQVANIKKRKDYALWLKIIDIADCYRLDKVLAKYTRRKGSVSRQPYLKLIKHNYNVFRLAQGMNILSSVFITGCNLFFGVAKKIIHTKKYNPLKEFHLS